MSNAEIPNPSGRPVVQFDPAFAQKVAGALNDPFTQMQLIKPFLEYLSQFIAVAGIPVPVGQVIGFQQFTIQEAPIVNTSETTTSTSYTDLATAGPELTGLPDGVYQLSFGARAQGTVAGQLVLMSVDVNGAGAADQNGVHWDNTANLATASRQVIATLDAGGNNTVTAKYKVTGGTGTFQYRYLHALRISGV